MPDLTQDELTLLLIAARGEPMMAIGKWQPAAESLIARGYLKPRPHVGDPTGHFNNHITATGKKALEDSEKADDEHLRDLLMGSRSVTHAHDKLRGTAEAIAVMMVDLAEASSKVTGESARESMEKWAKVIGKRALELVK